MIDVRSFYLEAFMPAKTSKHEHFKYLPGWRILASDEQLAVCERLFPELTLPTDDEFGKAMRRIHTMEGKAIIPKLSVAAERGVEQGADPKWPLFSQATHQLRLLFTKKFGDRAVFYYGDPTPDTVQMTERTLRAHQLLEEEFSGDYIVLPVQLGKQNANDNSRSPFDVENSLAPEEFCLDPYTLGMILLVHHELLDRAPLGSMRIECPGAKYSYRRDGKFVDAFRIDVQDGSLHFGEWNFQTRERPHQGTATGLAPRGITL